MTVEPDALESARPGADDATVPLRTLTGGLLSLRFFRDALRRRRRVWLFSALIGLLVGAGYHLAVPITYQATSTVYLAHPAASDTTVAAANDLAMLQTGAVGKEAIALLGKDGRGLTPKKLFGKAPGTIQSGNLLQISISGPTPAAAVQRVNAVTKAFLTFRAHLYESQDTALVAASQSEIANLQAEITTLNKKINNGTLSGSELAALQGARAAATTEITNLQQSIQQADLSTLSVTSGSRVVTPGTAAVSSKKKVFTLDGLAGLAVGLFAGMGAVMLGAALSDRLRRREDIATVIGVPVDVSVGPVRRRWTPGRSERLDVAHSRPLQVLVHYLDDQLEARQRANLLVVAADDAAVPAAALGALAARRTSRGERAVLVDDTSGRQLARSLGVRATGIATVKVAGADATLVVPPEPWEPEHDTRWLEMSEELARAAVVLIVGTVDPGLGAWHLRRWSSDAVVTVTTGRSTAQRLAALAELLDAAGITVASVAQLAADPGDESNGLGAPGATATGRRLGLVRSGSVLST